MTLNTLFRNFARKLQQSFPIVLRAPKKLTYIAGLGQVSGYQEHLRFVGTGAARSAWLKNSRADKFTRTTETKAAASKAIGRQTELALEALRMKGTAERAHIRAKYAVKLAELDLHKAIRDYGIGSAAAGIAKANFIKAHSESMVAQKELARHSDIF